MRLTTKGRFAVTAMIDLALRQNNGPVTLAAISQRQQISLSYLEQLFGKLRRNELVESTRGPGGGYTLARRAADITVADIITSVDEPIDATHCGGKENCQTDGSRCMTHDLWSSLNLRMVHATTCPSSSNKNDNDKCLLRKDPASHCKEETRSEEDESARD